MGFWVDNLGKLSNIPFIENQIFSFLESYLANKPFQVAGVLEDNARV